MVKKTPQRDLKGRMPERSEWLLAEGVAKRNPRYRDGSHVAKDAKTVAKEADIRVFQTHQVGWHDTEGFATLHPRLRATRFARAFDLSGRAAV